MLLKLDQPWFVFDVESIGLHGEAFAVAGGVYVGGVAVNEFCYSCPREEAHGRDDDREWVDDFIQHIDITDLSPDGVRNSFWACWCDAKSRYPDIKMAGECIWPVEARFVLECIKYDPIIRNWSGPYPFHEIASVMLCAGMDPMATYSRKDDELPAHNPLADARLSARLLHEAVTEIVKNDKIANETRGC